MTEASSTAARVLVVEDDESLRIVLADNLEQAGLAVETARDAAAARRALDAGSFDLVVLDLMLPDGDGYTLCREIHNRGCASRVLMLTARSLEDDIVRGFEAGADDYLVKPYRLRELMARVQALVRRAAPATPAGAHRTVRFGGCTLDLDARAVTDAEGRPIALTKTELDLLAAFLAHRGIVRTRDQLLDAAWGRDVVVEERTVDNFVSSLKKKLGWSAAAPWRIASVRGVGYRFELDEG